MPKPSVLFSLILLATAFPLTAVSSGAPQWDGDGGHSGDYSNIPRLRWTGPGTPGTYAEYLRGRASLPFNTTRIGTFASTSRSGRIVKALVLVDSALYASIQTRLGTYVADLVSDGYTVEVHQTSGGTHVDLKNFILGKTTDLVGCVFVGDHPAAWFEHDAWGYEEFPCDLFFMDLDGTWTDADIDGRYDTHTAGTGDVGPEIFIGHIDASMMSGTETNITNGYLDKNHLYRTGSIPLSGHALTYTEDDWATFPDMRTDIKHAYPSFDDIPAPATNRDDYLNNCLPNAAYEYIQLSCHSSAYAHYFTRGGQLYNTTVQAVPPWSVFYNLFCCSTLRYTSSDFLGGAYVYDAGARSLAVIGSTKTGSMLVFNAFYKPLGAGETYGESFRQWLNFLAPYSDSEIGWHYGMTIAGDPFLRLIEPALYVNFPNGLPAAYVPPGPATKVKLEITAGAENYLTGSGLLHYRFAPGASFSTAPLSALGGDLFEAVLPGAAPGDQPEFYFTVQGDGNSTVSSPYDAPASVYSCDVSLTEVVMEDDFEADLGWTVDNTAVTTGAFERADPLPSEIQPDDDHSPIGTFCYVTGRLGGTSGNDDLDGGPTRLVSPTIDLSGGDATIEFYLWFHHSTNGTQEPLTVEISNTGLAPWTRVMDVTNDPNWSLVSFKVSDHVPPTANVKIRISAEDNPNDSVVEALVDDFRVVRHMAAPSLWADAYAFSAAAGGVIGLNLDAGAGYGNRTYLVLASASGTSPGVPLPGGALLPLNWDMVCQVTLALIGTPLAENFYGSLDPAGRATATMRTAGPVDPVFVGGKLYFAYCFMDPSNYASNPIAVTIEP